MKNPMNDHLRRIEARERRQARHAAEESAMTEPVCSIPGSRWVEVPVQETYGDEPVQMAKCRWIRVDDDPESPNSEAKLRERGLLKEAP